MRIIEGSFQSPNHNIAIVASRFNTTIVNNLIEGALDTLTRVGGIKDSNIALIKVPGALEIPLATQQAAKTNKYQAIIVLGAVIQGETQHFNYITNSCNSILQTISLNLNIPITSGILTTENSEQALERSGLKMGNKGQEAAMATLEMLNVLQKIKEEQQDQL